MIYETEEKRIKIYEIKHSAFRKDIEMLVMADSMQEAIEKFNKQYENDCDVNKDDIIAVNLKYDFEVIV